MGQKSEMPVYGRHYHLYRDGSYLGIATWVQDSNVGDHFNRLIVNEQGRAVNEVYLADQWIVVS